MARFQNVALVALIFVAAVRFLAPLGVNQSKNGSSDTDNKRKDQEVKTADVNRRQEEVRSLLPFDLEKFLSTFVAANPKYTEDCKAYLRSPQEYNRKRNDYINWRWHFSQYNQDWFMFVNFFHQFVTSGKKGFYVESGTNDWIRVSNTAFYDLCLGWDGICIEPTKKHHDNIASFRTCELVTQCLSDKAETILMYGGVPGGDKGNSVDCVRLDSILDKRNKTTVDLWSLDVEGFEFKALAGIDFTKYHIQGLLMEQQDFANACAQFPIDYRLTMLGYTKYRIVSDGFYWKSDSPVRYANRTAMDGWFMELETQRCKKVGHDLKFFTDVTQNSTA